MPLDKFVPLLLRLIEKYEVFIPTIEQERPHFHRFSSEDTSTISFEHIRTVEPVKHFLFKPIESVASFDKPLEKGIKPQAIVGIKRCDLKAIEVYDKVFLDSEFVDPFYKKRRETTILISADCPQPEPTCFCNLLGLNPWVDEGADLNVTPVRSGYVIEPLSSKGEAIIEENKIWFENTSPEDLEQREASRKKALDKLKEINPDRFKEDLYERVNVNEQKFCLSEASGCVECCGCLMCCPTCYCFLLYDEPSNERVRIWDACYYAAYARVGGGANPMPDFTSRFKNRFECKFNYFYKYHGFFACTGCGRCISGCMGKIDIRKILLKL